MDEITRDPHASASSRETSARFPFILFGIIAVFMLFIGACGGYFFATKRTQPIPYTFPTNTQSEQATQIGKTNVASGWKVHTLPSVKLQFSLPASFGNLKEGLAPGEYGTQICAQKDLTAFHFIPKAYAGGGCNADFNEKIRIGTTSVDFQAGREGSFTDLQGFLKKGDLYYAKFVNNTLIELPSDKVSLITNAQGVSVLKIKGDTPMGETPAVSSAISVGEGTGLLINTKDVTYPGLAMLFSKDTQLTDAVLEKIIATLRFIE